MKYTLVQHSGSHKPGFTHAVEEAAIDNARQEAKITLAGGLVFESYDAAAKACETENYPPEVSGLYPRARGGFAAMELGGRKLYIPRRAGRG